MGGSPCARCRSDRQRNVVGASGTPVEIASAKRPQEAFCPPRWRSPKSRTLHFNPWWRQAPSNPLSEVDPSPVVIACGADSAYACPLAVMIRSVLLHTNSTRRIDFHVIDSGLTPEDRVRIGRGLDPRRVTLRWVSPRRESLTGLPLWGRMSAATYDKLLLPELLGPEVHRALWLDADLLVLSDIGPLWELPTGENLALAVTDLLVPTVSSPFGVAGWQTLRLDATTPYFNAGVLVLDLDACRTAQITQAALRYLHEHHDHVYFWDQEALNAVLAGRWAPLDPAWNRSPGQIPDGSSPHLVHFSGNLKPWLHPGTSRWHQLYYACLDQTDWAGWRPSSRAGRWLGWYQHSFLRRGVRRLEPWVMRAWRFRTMRSIPPTPPSFPAIL